MYSRILVPIDGSATGDRGLEEALSLAKTLGSRLILLHVIEGFPGMVDLSSIQSFDEGRSATAKAGRDVLEKAATRATARGVAYDTVLHERKTQRASDAIVHEVGAQQCSLVVMGTHGRRGFNRMLLGSDAELVVREAAVPVLLVRQSD